MVLAVLQRRAEVKVGKSDVYAATVGGVRLTEPSVDLAVALALASSVARPVHSAGLIVVGEVGLAGEVRNVVGVPRRVAEAERMGFRQAIVPAGSSAGNGFAADSAMEVVEVEDVREAMRAAFRGYGRHVQLERADRAGLAVRHGDRVEGAPGAGRTASPRSRTGLWPAGSR